MFDLVRQGMSVSAAARVAGVSSAAALLWCAQVGGVTSAQVQISARYLDREERYEIARLREAGMSMRQIAARLGRAPSTVSRELSRNTAVRAAGARRRYRAELPGRYEPERAHTLARQRRARPKSRKLDRHLPLRELVQARLDERDSPQQISGRLKVDFAGDPNMQISHEAIYQAIYLRAGGALRRQVRAHLRTGRSTRKPRNARTPNSRRSGAIVGAVSIRDRPAEVAERLVPGHHEGDLIMGNVASNSAIGTIVERTTGFVTLLHLPHGHTADLVAAAIAAQVTGLPRDFWKTITWDRGSEMARHARLTAETGIKVYFADPHAPWQRGTNENTNGLLREFFPKGTDLSVHTAADLRRVEDNLNNRPRKRLAYRTPNEALASLIEQDIIGSVATFG